MSRLLEPVRRRRIQFVAVLAAFVAAAAGLVVVPQLAAAAPPVSATITAGKAYMPDIPVPAASTKYSGFVVRDTAFVVPFTTDVPLSTSAATKVSLTVDSGRNKGLVLGTTDLEADATAGAITAASGLPTPANNITLTVSAKGSGIASGTTTVDVVSTHVSSTATLTGIGAGGGAGVPCAPTSTPGDQTCGDLLIPEGLPVPDQLLTQGLCTAACKYKSGGSVLQWLATLGAGVDREHPVVFVAKCDKSLCSGKGIKSYTVTAQTDIAHAPKTSPACLSKGVVNPNEDFCTDYVQSTRDGAGDVLLVVLFAADAKIIW
jgi:hypothetical protein